MASVQNSINWVVIGNPENRRIKSFTLALERWQQKLVMVLSYLDLASQDCLDNYLYNRLKNTSGKIVVRFDSPGENETLEKLILSIADKNRAERDYRHGQIVDSQRWYQGYSRLLKRLTYALETVQKRLQKPIYFMNSSDEILSLFDKKRTLQRLCKNSINTPRALPNSSNFTELVESMRSHNCLKVFVKLRYGSSASGVAALQISARDKNGSLTTSVEIDKRKTSTRFFNSLKVKTYTDNASIVKIIDFLLAQEAVIEAWIPKSVHQNKCYDLRVVTIGSTPEFFVVRQSNTPITNLHLGNLRTNIEELSLCRTQREKIDKQITGAAKTFGEMTTIGWDVLLTGKNKTPYIIEGNAFGDLLPGLKNEIGDTYDNQINHWLSKSLC